MLFPKKISEQIKTAIKNNQTPQEILCKNILWQYSYIQKALSDYNKDISIENFLSVYLKIDINKLQKILESLKDYKDVVGADIMAECLSCKINGD